MGNANQVIREGEYDEDGALHISGISAFAAATQPGWRGATLDGGEDENTPETRRAHVTCPRCAATNNADADICWNCESAL